MAVDYSVSIVLAQGNRFLVRESSWYYSDKSSSSLDEDASSLKLGDIAEDVRVIE